MLARQNFVFNFSRLSLSESVWSRKEEYERFLIESGAVKVLPTPIRLKSGRLSNVYIDLRFPSPSLHLRNASFIADFIESEGIEFDCVYGVPTAGDLYACFLSAVLYERGKDVRISKGRKRPKSHGRPEQRFFVVPPKGRTLVVDDVLTTGFSILEELHYKLRPLEKAGEIEVAGILVCVDRCESTPIPGEDEKEVVTKYKELYESLTGMPYEPKLAREVFDDLSIEFYALTDMPSLLSRIRSEETPF